MNPPSVWEVFVPYGGLHALAVVVCTVLIVVPSLIGRRLEKNREATLRRALAVLAIGYWLAYNIWWNWNGLDLRTGLPLQLCDFNGLVAPLALLTGWRWARAALYFWTVALTSQAFIQPALTSGPASPVFWAFWTAHTIIAACAAYDVVVRGFRPNWNDLGAPLPPAPSTSRWSYRSICGLAPITAMSAIRLTAKRCRRSSTRSDPGRSAPSYWWR
jgi:hypothetical integral membrane protein (TIGR02206 family)